MAKVTRRAFLLDETRIPKTWYNIAADLPSPPDPPVHPATGQPLGPDDLAPLFPLSLIQQEVSTEPEIEIPEPVRDIYRLWRPTPLYYAHRLKAALDTPAHLFYKYEGGSPPGSHKPNTAVAQAFYNRQEGVRRLTTETGAGQWGSALAFGCNLFDIECQVYMVKVSYQQKPGRRVMMETYGARVTPSPSQDTEPGRQILAADPDSPGSLGIAISEAVWEAAINEGTKYSLGSVLNHVLLHQTVIGQEAQEQLGMAQIAPDILIGCVGGGSNFAGFAFPFMGDKLKGRASPRIIAVEPTACPTFTKGRFTYDYGDTAGLTPLMKMHTLGSSFVPPPIHAGGLRYHGMAPLLCHLYNLGVFEARAYPQLDVFEAAVLFARAEGIIPAPEPAHAIRAAIDEALAAREAGEERVIVFNMCGHGHFDLSAYEAYLGGRLENYAYPEEKIRQAIERLPQMPTA